MGFGEFKTGILRFAYFKWGLGISTTFYPPHLMMRGNMNYVKLLSFL